MSLSNNLEPEKPKLDSDASLLRRVQDGELAAAASLYVRYAIRLHGLAVRKTSRELAKEVPAEDIVQSVFRTFFRRASKGAYHLPESDELWRLLMVMTLNKIRRASEFYRAARRDIRRKVTGSDALIDEQLKDEGFQDSSALTVLKMTVEDCISKYPPLQGEMIRLRFDGYEIEEIAKKTSRSKRTVERTLQDFRNWLSRQLCETDQQLSGQERISQDPADDSGKVQESKEPNDAANE